MGSKKQLANAPICCSPKEAKPLCLMVSLVNLCYTFYREKSHAQLAPYYYVLAHVMENKP